MDIKLTKQETEEAIHSLKRYFVAELETELTDLRASLLLDYMLKELGPLSYNRGVQDAEHFLRARVDDLSGSCFEQPMTYWNAKKKR